MRILYEDDSLLFIDKPPGIVVQRAHHPDEEVLFETASRHAASRGEQLFLVQRLDRGTSGVLFFSKRPEVNRALTRAFERREIRKIYLALCEGQIRERQWIDAPIARVGAIKFGVRPEGKRSLTSVIPLSAGRSGSLIGLELLTGRTHQIRVHLAAIGHPLIGDWLYGTRSDDRPLLHAWSISMRHPRSGEPLEVVAEPPEDFAAASKARGLRMEEGIELLRTCWRGSSSPTSDGVDSAGVGRSN